MKFRAVRPTQFADADVVVVALFDDKQLPKGLTRATRTVVERMAAETGAARLCSVPRSAKRSG